jgi:cysteine-rich repeat protein
MFSRSSSTVVVAAALALGAAWAPAACSSSNSSNTTTAPTTTAAATTGSGGAGGTPTTVATTTGGGQGGGTTTTGGGGGAGGAPPANETCATAEVHMITRDGPMLTVDATTEGAMTSVFHGSCANKVGMDAPSVVYELELNEEGTFKLSVDAMAPSTLVPAVLERTVCDTDDLCFASSPTDELLAADLMPGDYWFIVTGQNNTAGAFQLTATLTTAACGDGVVNPNEQCDLGNVPDSQWAADGCNPPGSAMPCTYTAASPLLATCPGKQIIIPANTSNQLEDMGTNIGFPSNYVGSCSAAADPDGGAGSCPNAGGPTRVYTLIPQATGMMTVSVGYDTNGTTTICSEDINDPGCWNTALFAETICGDMTSEPTCTDAANCVGGLACSQPSVCVGAAIITFAATEDVPYFVFVGGYDCTIYSAGPYNLFVTLQ